MSKAEYDVALSRIIEYLTTQGIEINLRSNRFEFDAEEWCINCAARSAGTISMICSILHEAGHAKQYSTAFNILPASKKRYQAIIIEQEYKAWEEGWNIARTLYIDEMPNIYREYHKLWLSSWTSYICTVTQPACNIKQLASGYDYVLSPRCNKGRKPRVEPGRKPRGNP